MKLHAMAYLCKAGVRSAFLSGAMSFASMGVMTACLFLTGTALVGRQYLSDMAARWGRGQELTVYLVDTCDAGDTARLEQRFLEMEEVLSVRHVSSGEALAEMSGRLAETPENLLGDPADNPFLAAFVLRVESERYDDCLAAAGTLPAVYAVRGSPDTARVLESARRFAAFAGAGTAGLLAAASALIVGNTVRLTAHGRRRELAVMRMVGANNAAIRAPFIVEGAVLGLVSAAGACAILLGISALLRRGMAAAGSGGYLADVLRPLENAAAVWPRLCAFLGAAGVCIGMFSGASVRRYLWE